MLPDPYWRDPSFELHVGDARELGPLLDPGSVDCVVCSPPYWGLRDYGTGFWVGGADPDCKHESAKRKTRYDYSLANSHKQTGSPGTDAQQAMWLPRCGECGAQRVDKQIGLEADLRVYIENLTTVFSSLRDGLSARSTLWINLGDRYSDRRLLGVPWRFAFAMVDAGWHLRAEIIWSKPNAMTESVTARPTRAHEHIFFFSKSDDYFFDQDAVRVPHKPDGRKKTTVQQGAHSIQHRSGERWPGEGRNIRTVWEFPNGATSDDHYAAFPLELPRLCIAAGCPEGGLVLDPFLGTGTTARVALDLGRRSLGFELSESYAAIAIQRLGQQSLFTALEV